MNFNFHKLYLKLAIFCLLNIFTVGIIGSIITYWNVNSFIEYVVTKGSNKRLGWIKKIVTTEALQPRAETGVLDIAALNQYLLELADKRGLAGVWISDGNDRVLAGSKPQNHEQKKIDSSDGMGLPFIKYYFTKTLIEPKPLAITLPGYQATLIHMLAFPELPDRLKKSMGIMLFLGLLGLFINALLIYILVAWFIIKPIRHIRAELNKVMQGDLSHRISNKSRDEIGELVVDINNMADMTEKLINGSQQLSANLSHEIRTPLSQIRIASDILRLRIGAVDNQKLESKFTSIEQDIEKIDRLIDKFLAFSHYKFQTDSSRREPIQLEPVMTSVLNGLKSQIKLKCLDVRSQWNGENVTLLAIPDDVSLIFSNLLSNAVKYSNENGIIQVRAMKSEDAILISIANTCDPMVDEEIDQVFRPFNKIQYTDEPGTKLGLTITRKLVDKYRGSISASRWKDEGLCIELLFPSLHNGIEG
jgi:signal transduction histidine kinase